MKTRDNLFLHVAKVGTTLMNVLRRGRTTGWTSWHGKPLVAKDSMRAKNLLQTIHPNQQRASSPINDNYCVKVLQTGLLAGSKPPTSRNTINSHVSKTLVNSLVVNPVLTAPGLSQKKDINPGVSSSYQEVKLKYVKDVFCVDQLSFVKPVTNVPTVASNLPVGARLQYF